jgi:AraC family transcriptional regulator of adaptative response/methylated-DNA-[protein]-cysteine methyltransferase
MEKTMADTIRYAAGQSSLGPFVAALSGRGLAMVEFGEMNEADLRVRFPDADLVEVPASLHKILDRLAALIEHPESHGDFALDLQGSAFELKVWQALLAIPEGKIVSYRSVAETVCTARASRAVGAAVGRNPIALIIPCHRVLASSGALTGYHWGVNRKRALLAFEAAHTVVS